MSHEQTPLDKMMPKEQTDVDKPQYAELIILIPSSLLLLFVYEFGIKDNSIS
jgi:hypothetical protein